MKSVSPFKTLVVMRPAVTALFSEIVPMHLVAAYNGIQCRHVEDQSTCASHSAHCKWIVPHVARAKRRTSFCALSGPHRVQNCTERGTIGGDILRGQGRNFGVGASDSISRRSRNDKNGRNGRSGKSHRQSGGFARCQANEGNEGSRQSRRELLLEYVRTVQPEFMEKFVQRAPPQVVGAMRETVSNMIGTLPPQFFNVTISTVGENLAQLMYSVMMTGYMFRNAQYRMDLSESMIASPNENKMGSRKSDSPYERGVQKVGVGGHIVRWHKSDGPKSIEAAKYIQVLEAEVEELREQLEGAERGLDGTNPILLYFKKLQPQNLQELSASAGEDALHAMNEFIQRLLGVTGPQAVELKTTTSETTASELGTMLYWLMVVGYSLRNIEVRYDMDRILGVSATLAELPPGEL